MPRDFARADSGCRDRKAAMPAAGMQSDGNMPWAVSVRLSDGTRFDRERCDFLGRVGAQGEGRGTTQDGKELVSLVI